MLFNEFHDGYTIAKRNGFVDKQTDFDAFMEAMDQMGHRMKNSFTVRQVMLEKEWVAQCRPYYNVWPVIFDMVNKLKLDIPCSAVQMPNQVFCLRLPAINNPLSFEGGTIKTIVFGTQPVSKSVGSREAADGMCLMLDTGELSEDRTCPIYTFKIFPWLSDQTIDYVMNSLPSHTSWFEGIVVPQDVITQAIKLAIVVCMIYKDPEIVTPDVLAKDRSNYMEALAKGDAAKIASIEDRAKRRGKCAFNIGMSIESMPHYRRPHMALFWMGKGRSLAKIQLRKGAIVHRDKLTNVPSGYVSTVPEASE
jgi:hypothetical protein